METTGLTAMQLRALVMDRVRQEQACATLHTVDIVPAKERSASGGWPAVPRSRTGTLVSYECNRRVLFAVDALRKQYHLIGDEPEQGPDE
jgi:hypothetical protein